MAVSPEKKFQKVSVWGRMMEPNDARRNARRNQYRAPNTRPRDWSEADNTLLLSDSSIHDNWSWIKNREIYIRGNERYEAILEHRLYSAAELSCLLHDSGFAKVDIYGGLDGRSYDQNTNRLIVVARV